MRKTRNGIIDVKPFEVKPMNVIMDLTGQRPKQRRIATTTLFKPIRIIPADTHLVDVQRSGETTFHQGKGKDCSLSQINFYRDNWNDPRIGLPHYTQKYLRKHRTSTIHGRRSLNAILTDSPITEDDPNDPLYRASQDYDLYIPKKNLKRHVTKMSKKLDEKVGCDISYTVHTPIPNISGRDDPSMCKELYRVVTPYISRDSEIDAMESPKGLRIQRHRGISHEHLDQAYEKACSGLYSPMRMWKSLTDKRQIEEYRRLKGIKPKTYGNNYLMYRGGL